MKLDQLPEGYSNVDLYFELCGYIKKPFSWSAIRSAQRPGWMYWKVVSADGWNLADGYVTPEKVEEAEELFMDICNVRFA